MPVTCRKMNDKWRIVHGKEKQLSKTEKGSPRDGGGHDSHKDCMAQARAMNSKEDQGKDG